MSQRVERRLYVVFIFGIGIGIGWFLANRSAHTSQYQNQKTFIAATLETQWVNAQWDADTALDRFNKGDTTGAQAALGGAIVRIEQAQLIGEIYSRGYVDTALTAEIQLYFKDVPGLYIQDLQTVASQPYTDDQRQLLISVINDLQMYAMTFSQGNLAGADAENFPNTLRQMQSRLQNVHVQNALKK